MRTENIFLESVGNFKLLKAKRDFGVCLRKKKKTSRQSEFTTAIRSTRIREKSRVSAVHVVLKRKGGLKPVIKKI